MRRAASALALGDDHGGTVEIVARTLGRLSADATTEFVAWGHNPETAARIVYAALETEASENDDHSITASPPVPECDAVMRIMIKQVMLPMAKRMLVEQAELCAHLSRLVDSVSVVSV